VNFPLYKALARDILASERGARLLRLDCMNPVKALAAMRPALPERPRRSSTRELEASWRARWDLLTVPGRVVLSTGVRPLLSRLFASFAREGRRLHAPEDVYPVYLESAVSAKLPVTTFPTVPTPILPISRPGHEAEVLLVPEPLVPVGRGLNGEEVARISCWLDDDERRLLLLDCVYTFGERFTPAARALLARGQTVLLHSLAKTFLCPDTAGFAIGPASVLGAFEHQIGDDGLVTATHVLNEAADLPVRLGRMFSQQWSRLDHALGIPVPATGYFSVVAVPFDELVARGQLAVPGSVFGARDAGWCAVTCLLADSPGRPARVR
jgi:hypothetical protein